MPCFMVCDGTHQEVNDDVFDAMVQALNTETPTSTPKANMSRRNADGSYKKKTTGWKLFQNILSAKSINTHNLPWLWKDNIKQIQPFKT